MNWDTSSRCKANEAWFLNPDAQSDYNIREVFMSIRTICRKKRYCSSHQQVEHVARSDIDLTVIPSASCISRVNDANLFLNSDMAVVDNSLVIFDLEIWNLDFPLVDVALVK